MSEVLEPGEPVARYEVMAIAALARLHINQDDGESHKEAGYALAMLGSFELASHHASMAARLLPHDVEAQRNLALERLRAGRWSEGWELLRRLKPKASCPAAVAPDCEEWAGDMVPGYRLLLVGEQGLGDQLQMLRIAAILAARGMQVDALVSPPLWRVVSGCAGIRKVWTGRPPGEYDGWCYLFRAAQLTLASEDAISRHLPYFTCDPLRTRVWRRRLTAFDTMVSPHVRRIRVGLVWSGNPAHDADRHRSMAFGQLVPLIRSMDVTWFSLQFGVGPENAPAESNGLDIRFLGKAVGSFAHTQALLHELDLLISVDTSAVHLAGASGFPVWVLVSAATDWRWMAAGSSSPWYRSVRIFRQHRLDDWAPVLREVADALADMAKKAPIART